VADQQAAIPGRRGRPPRPLGAPPALLRNLALAGLCWILFTPAHAAPKDELNDLRGRIKALQKEIESAQGTKSDATDALRQSEQAISASNRHLRELSQQQQEVDAVLARTQQEARSTQARIAEQQDLLGKLLYQQYLHGEQDAVSLLLNQQDPNTVARQLHYLTYVGQARAELIGDLRQNLQQSREFARVYQEKSAELDRIKAEQSAQRRQLEKERSARKTVLARIDRQITSQRHEIGRLQQDEKRLTRLVERLARMLPRSKPAQPRKGAPLRNEHLPAPDQSGSAFVQLKGKLHLPVRGELANRFGSPREDGGATWRGLFIRSPAGQEVKAVASGRVVFSDWLRGFGNIVIVDHGDGYMSLYGNNETLYKQAGETVRAGDAIATVGNSGGNPQTGLYFEMRYQSRPFDPLGWVRLN
jgi:septal ring factor EnvC (AmiA/AmiB activator)